MARFRRRTPLLPGLVFLLALGGAGFWGWKHFHPADPLTGLPELVIADYFSNANSLRGNVYRLKGVVDDNLAWSPEKGKIVSLIVTSSDGSRSEPLPVKIPADITENIQSGQTLTLRVKVHLGGLLIADQIFKS